MKKRSFLCGLLAFLLLFIISMIILKIVARLLNLATKLPVINGVNKAMSIPLGAVLALFRIFCFCSIIKLILPYTGILHIGALNQAAIDSTFIFKIFYGIDIIAKLFL